MDPIANAVVNVGAFGLVTFIVIYATQKTIPTMIADHKEAIKSITDTFTKESQECREERITQAQIAAAEREKDRVARHEAVEKMQEIVATVLLAKKSETVEGIPPLLPEVKPRKSPPAKDNT